MEEVNNSITHFNHAIYYHNIYYKNYYFIIALAYLPVIFKIKYIMEKFPPFKNKLSNLLLGMWNIFLSSGSLIGTYYVLPFLLSDLYNNGIIESTCKGYYRYNNYVSLVITLFNISKFLEFIDTLFIVFRKSNLDFLHYYHHIITCLYCWNSSYFQISTGIYFAGINLIVHSIMYFYYALLAFDIKILVPYKKYITILQTTQMGLGTTVIIVWINNCRHEYNIYHLLNHIMGLLMYISYGYLFSLLLFSNKKKVIKNI